ncbi:MAG: hypothetical protein ACXWC3_29525 [Burkholderiales bacterium]
MESDPAVTPHPPARLTSLRTEIERDVSPDQLVPMTVSSQPNAIDNDELEAAIDQAIAACDGDLRATIGALIVANNFL